jgi:hypothetical protein
VVWIVVDDDVISIPIPSTAEADIKRRYTPEEPAKAEPLGPATT